MQLYTVDRANRTLPLVRRIVEDIVREHERWQDAIARLDLLMATNSDTVDLRTAALEREVQAIARDIDAFQASLRRSTSSSRIVVSVSWTSPPSSMGDACSSAGASASRRCSTGTTKTPVTPAANHSCRRWSADPHHCT